MDLHRSPLTRHPLAPIITPLGRARQGALGRQPYWKALYMVHAITPYYWVVLNTHTLVLHAHAWTLCTTTHALEHSVNPEHAVASKGGDDGPADPLRIGAFFWTEVFPDPKVESQKDPKGNLVENSLRRQKVQTPVPDPQEEEGGAGPLPL